MSFSPPPSGLPKTQPMPAFPRPVEGSEPSVKTTLSWGPPAERSTPIAAEVPANASTLTIGLLAGGGCLAVGMVALIAVVASAFVFSEEDDTAPRVHSAGTLATPNVALPIDPHAAERFQIPVPPGTPVRGSHRSLVTIVEFGDFECPFCRNANHTIELLLAEYPDQVRHVWRHNPLSHHTRARDAARASMEAYAQRGDEGFWRMHELLYEDGYGLADSGLRYSAIRAGLDLSRFEIAMESSAHDTIVQRDQLLAQQIGATGTPTFFVNGRMLQGAQSIESFRAVIAEELRHAQSVVAAGVAPEQVYWTLVGHGRTTPLPAPSPTDPNALHRVPIGSSPVIGPSDALVTIVAFEDFQCPYCSRASRTLSDLRASYASDVRLVFKHNPLAFHERARASANAAMEVQRQLGDWGFWRMRDLLHENQSALSDADLATYARRVGADGVQVAAAIYADRYSMEIEEDRTLASTLGARGTPTFFINGRMISGAQPESEFRRVIDEELARARLMVASGTPRTVVYDTIQARAY
jgi:protein-disulfide isomerase